MIAFITSTDTERLQLAEAAKSCPAGFAGVLIGHCNDLQAEEQVNAFLSGPAASAGLFLVHVLGGLRYFQRAFELLEVFCRQQKRPLLILPGDNQPDAELAALSNVPLADVHTSLEYLIEGGVENYKHLLLFLSDVYLGSALGFKSPAACPEAGLYHPDAASRAECARLDLAGFRRHYWREDRPAVAVLFYRAFWQSGNLEHIDALVRELENNACNVLPVFCYSLSLGSAEAREDVSTRYLGGEGGVVIDCIISTMGYSGSRLRHEGRTTIASGESLSEALRVPVVQALSTFQTEDRWASSPAGLLPLDAAMYAVLPEFDGRLIGPVLSAKSAGAEAADSADSRRSQPIGERAAVLSHYARNLAMLRRKPNAEKRICIMLTNFANKQGRIGSAVGLDTPESVIRILKGLRSRGYQVEDMPESGDALMCQLIDCGGYDQEYLTEEQLALAGAGFSAARYGEWFANYPGRNQQELCEAWGQPPGSVMRSGEQIYVAGLQLGHVFVMIQPPRGFGENPLAVYHSGELVPSHQYLGAYRWLRDEFRADAVIHCGKHGTLEWLPGKALGLSESCYPDLGISAIPVFYPFIVNDPGEGTQAKRRIHACIIDHLVPPLTRAETYDHLARLQQLLGSYAQAQITDPDKLPFIAGEIWDLTVESQLHLDLGVQSQPSPEEFGEFIQHVDGYLCEIGDLQIRDGLHILGQVPEGDQLIDLALALLRLDGTEWLGLRHALARDLGLDYVRLSDRRSASEPCPEAATLARFDCRPDSPEPRCGEVMEALWNLGRLLLKDVLLGACGSEAIAGAGRRAGLPANGEVVRTLRFFCERILPDLKRTSDEITHLLDGLAGAAVPAGPSGAPSRGMVNVLPTGRNFYSVDVRAIPSRFTWQVGERLASELIEHFRRQRGREPETVGITVWGSANMRTHGDDVAEILWLLGVTPEWEPENQRIRGLSVLPLEQLRRPRIDVTVRMSGFFRDAFPDVVRLLDQAVAMVAGLDEPASHNYIRKHVLARQEQLLGEGLSPEEAARRAYFRLFSNKPGVYGTGLLNAITSGHWATDQDLAQIYLESGGYAYTGSVYGEPAPGEFRSLLASSEVAVQNLDNREHDIFDSDDYFQFHGGMVAAIRSLTGKAPVAVLGDSSNPDQPQVDDLQREARRIFRARVVNPKWIEAIRRHGYKGAVEMAATIDYLFGYDATANVADDWMYQQLAEKYLIDEQSRRFLEKSNPWAMREMAGRLLEAADRQMWEAPAPETLEQLREIYLATEAALEGGEIVP
ncbi:MAG: cobaltochelatase subunit CobN [Acidobacteriota bacterium]